jgi:hypothetical protein
MISDLPQSNGIKVSNFDFQLPETQTITNITPRNFPSFGDTGSLRDKDLHKTFTSSGSKGNFSTKILEAQQKMKDHPIF